MQSRLSIGAIPLGAPLPLEFLFDPAVDVHEPFDRTRQPAHSQSADAPARDGGLLSYAVDRADTFRRAASYVDRILRGEKPGGLPVQFSTKFEMAVNLKTAKALGLTLPPTLVAIADEVIE